METKKTEYCLYFEYRTEIKKRDDESDDFLVLTPESSIRFKGCYLFTAKSLQYHK